LLNDADSAFAQQSEFQSLDIIHHIPIYILVDSLNVVEKVDPKTKKKRIAFADATPTGVCDSFRCGSGLPST